MSLKKNYTSVILVSLNYKTLLKYKLPFIPSNSIIILTLTESCLLDLQGRF